MGRNYSVHINPYKDAADSDITSSVFHLMDAYDWSYSWYTTSGATSRVTLEISNSGEADSADIPEASWSRWTVFGHTKPPGSGASTEFPPLGVRYGRFLRWPSSATTLRGITIDVNKQVS